MVVVAAAAGVAALDWRRAQAQAELDRTRAAREVQPLGAFGAVRDIEIAPLITWRGAPSQQTEAGVSYLVRADTMTIPVDLGLNSADESPSSFAQNVEALDVTVADIDALFITHAHRDHVGGAGFERARSFDFTPANTRPRV